MSVLIRGMKMPEKCPDCNFESECGFCLAKSPDFCGYTDELVRPDWCPLIELPEKHGRLIDKDRLKREMLWNFAGERIPIYDYDGNPVDFHVKDVEATINSQPTVIEAEDAR